MNFAAKKQIIPTRLCTVPIRTGSFKRFCTVMTDKSSNLSQSETKQDSIIPMPGRALKKMTIGSGLSGLQFETSVIKQSLNKNKHPSFLTF